MWHPGQFYYWLAGRQKTLHKLKASAKSERSLGPIWDFGSQIPHAILIARKD